MKRTSIAALAVLVVALLGCRSESQYICKSRQAEAQANLKALHANQERYKAANGKYASSTADLGFTPGSDRYYDIKIDSASDTAYSATATGKAQAAGDIWTIDQSGATVAKTDKCKR